MVAQVRNDSAEMGEQGADRKCGRELVNNGHLGKIGFGFFRDAQDQQRAVIMWRAAGTSVFVGGFDLDAAVAVASDESRGTAADLIGRLTDKSLLKHRHGPEGSRWQMLETIRAYAVDRLAESDEAAARSEERRVGKECCLVCRSRWSPYH